MCRVQECQVSLSYFLSNFPLIVSDAISCPLHNLNTHLVFYHDTLQLCRTYLDDVSDTRMTTLTYILFEFFPLTYILSYFPLMVSNVISCPLHNLNALCYIIINTLQL